MSKKKPEVECQECGWKGMEKELGSVEKENEPRYNEEISQIYFQTLQFIEAQNNKMEEMCGKHQRECHEMRLYDGYGNRMFREVVIERSTPSTYTDDVCPSCGCDYAIVDLTVDPHIACYSYPNCDIDTLGCVVAHGMDAECYGHRD